MLKWLALLFMFVDHFAIILEDKISVETYFTMRALGRISFPIFVYYIVKGMQRTSNIKSYIKRIAIFAVLAEISRYAFEIFHFGFLNVLFSFILYVIMYAILSEKINYGKFINYSILIISFILISFVEFGYGGLLVFISIYAVDKHVSNVKFKPLVVSMLIPISFMIAGSGYIQIFAFIAGLFMFNEVLDKRLFNKKIEKWAFYGAYPTQWIILGLIHKVFL